MATQAAEAPQEVDSIPMLRLAVASHLAYTPDGCESFDPKHCEIIRAILGASHVVTFESGGSQAFLAADGTQAYRDAILAFRGSNEKVDWLRNIRLKKTRFLDYGKVHSGFLRALDFIGPSIRVELGKLQAAGMRNLYVTGHSLGAAMATLFTAEALTCSIRPRELVTFGSPRVGDRRFAKKFNAEFGIATTRFVNNNDLVCRLPPAFPFYSLQCRGFTTGFRHVGARLIYITEGGRLVLNPSRERRVREFFKGVAEEFGKPGLDALKDHPMHLYREALERERCD